jgi:hypothetical protein
MSVWHGALRGTIPRLARRSQAYASGNCSEPRELARFEPAVYAAPMREHPRHTSRYVVSRARSVLALLVMLSAASPVAAQSKTQGTLVPEQPPPDAVAPSDAAAAPPANDDPDVPPPPPAPPQAGDYAGGAPEGPQEDFETDAQEYSHPDRREFSVRIDPLNWLLLGRLGVELEGTLWKFLTVQITPIFVTAHSPIALNYAGFDDPLTQHSNGLGPLAGASIGVGAWLMGTPFRGYVIRLELTNYGYEYRASDGRGVFDKAEFTERRVIAFFGSHSRYGPFTFAGGFGLGYELHQVERCGLMQTGSNDTITGRSSGCSGKQLIALDRRADDRADLNGPLHPVYFQARFSIGVVF